jgi:prevent-host-death family protein
MSVTMNIHQAKTNLSQLIEKALAGEEVIIAKAGTPIIRLTPIQTSLPERRPGGWAGQVVLANDFDELPDDFVAAFE